MSFDILLTFEGRQTLIEYGIMYLSERIGVINESR